MVESAHAAEGARAGRRRVLKGLGTLGVAGGVLAVAGSKPATADSGSGSNGTSVTVAASDSPEVLQNSADWVCSGANDDVVINQAIAQVSGAQADGAGEVFLLPGDFVLGSGASSFINLSAEYGRLQLRGSGTTATMIHVPSGSAAPAAIVAASWNATPGTLTVRDLQVSGPGNDGTGATAGVLTQCSEPRLVNVTVNGAAGHGFVLDGHPLSQDQVGAPAAAGSQYTTWNGHVKDCSVYNCGTAILNGGAPGDGFHITAQHQNAAVTDCFVAGGNNGISAALLTATVAMGDSPSSLSVSPLPAAFDGGASLVICGAGSYQVLTVGSQGADQGATSIPVSGFTATSDFWGGLTVVLDPAVTTTRYGFYTQATTHWNDCHPYFCWHGGFVDESAAFINGGEYETCAFAGISAILSGTDQYKLGTPDTPLQILGINSYGNPGVANIYVWAGTSGVQICNNLISGGSSLFGIYNKDGNYHIVTGNHIYDAVGPGPGGYSGSAGIRYETDGTSGTGVGHVISGNIISLSSQAPTLTAQHYGISLTGITNSIIQGNSVSGCASQANSTPIAAQGTSTGTEIVSNPGYN